MTPEEQTQLSEITILPDGRIYVFGMSRPVLEVLALLQTHDPRLNRLCAQLSMPSSLAGVQTEEKP